MNKKSMLVFIIALALAAFGYGVPAYAGGGAYTCPTFYFWPTNNAPGQPWSGTATIYIDNTTVPPTVDWFLRIGKGENVLPFFGSFTDSSALSAPYYCTPEDTNNNCLFGEDPAPCSGYQDSVQYLLLQTYAGPQIVSTLGYPPGTPIALQSISNMVQGAGTEETSSTPETYFWMFDFTVAINGKIQK